MSFIHCKRYIVRLVKYLAERGLGSRRQLDRYIQTVGVWIDGQHIFNPATTVLPGHHIIVGDQVVDAVKPQRRVLLFYKPKGVLTTHHDPYGRPCVADFIDDLDPSLKTVGRLDQDSEGLLVLTNDGGFKRFLELPAHRIKRTYDVCYEGELDGKSILRAAEGITVRGVRYGACHIERLNHQAGKKHWCRVQICEGKNREVRKIMGSFGCVVRRLVRISYGPFSLGRLTTGEMRVE